jgi:hypothetical protein
MSTSATTFKSGFQLRFRPLSGTGRGYCFPCDPGGRVDLDALGARDRNDYFFARTVIGRELARPAVQAGAAAP